MLSFLLVGHTLKKEGASRVTGILPYLAYSREDKLKDGQSLATAWMGGLLKASGFDEIWTIDLHSEQDQQLFPLLLESLSRSKIFHESLAKLGLTSASFVSPDQGAIPSCLLAKTGVGWRRGTLYLRDTRIVYRAAVAEPLVSPGEA